MIVPVSTHRSKGREGEVMAVLRAQRAAVWPDRCPDCGGAMEFGFAPVVHRRCPCGKTVMEDDLAAPERVIADDGNVGGRWT